jgi:hypothetical protein
VPLLRFLLALVPFFALHGSAGVRGGARAEVLQSLSMSLGKSSALPMATKPLSRAASRHEDVLSRMKECLGESASCGRVLEECPEPTSVMSLCRKADYCRAAEFLLDMAVICAPGPIKVGCARVAGACEA